MHGPGAGMTTRRARFARGRIAAIESLCVAACSQALAGGSLSATAGIALSGATCVLLAGKTLGLARLSTAVVLSQLLFHGPFSLLADAPLGASTPAEAGMLYGAQRYCNSALRHPRCPRGLSMPSSGCGSAMRSEPRLLDPPVSRTSDPRDRSLNFRQARSDRPLLSTPAQDLL